jgi:molybdenum cofactor cytidylyltransferase
MARIAAIILAAGKGRRMGQPKLFLSSGGRAFLELVAGTLESAGIRDIIAVVREGDKEPAKALAKNCRLVVNEHPENGPLSSLRAGLDSSPGFDGYLVAPVDHPFIKPTTVIGLVGEFQRDPNKIIKPAFRGKDGHPVIIPRVLTEKVPGSDLEGGLAGLIRASGLGIIRLEINDRGIFKNVNTTGDLK